LSEKMSKKVGDKTYEYEIYKLVDQFSDVLTTRTQDFDFANPPIDPIYLAVSLLETMIKHGGVGLAAPQCGVSYRVFVMGAPGGQGYACFNPKITGTRGNPESAFEEGCLSFKGLYLNIKRPEAVEVEYQDMYGNKHTQIWDGLTARTFQHELDHLNGVVYTTLVDRYSLDKAKTKVKTNLKKLQRQRDNHERQAIIQRAMQTVAAQKKVDELAAQINIDIPDINVVVNNDEPVGG
jgi:peptide deformylase